MIFSQMVLHVTKRPFEGLDGVALGALCIRKAEKFGKQEDRKLGDHAFGPWVVRGAHQEPGRQQPMEHLGRWNVKRRFRKFACQRLRHTARRYGAPGMVRLALRGKLKVLTMARQKKRNGIQRKRAALVVHADFAPARVQDNQLIVRLDARSAGTARLIDDLPETGLFGKRVLVYPEEAAAFDGFHGQE